MENNCFPIHITIAFANERVQCAVKLSYEPEKALKALRANLVNFTK